MQKLVCAKIIILIIENAQGQRTATRIWSAITTQLRHSNTLGAEHKAIFCPSSLFTVHPLPRTQNYSHVTRTGRTHRRAHNGGMTVKGSNSLIPPFRAAMLSAWRRGNSHLGVIALAKLHHTFLIEPMREHTRRMALRARPLCRTSTLTLYFCIIPCTHGEVYCENARIDGLKS